MSEDERVLIYLGPTLSKDEAIRLVPDAIIRSPARQSDIISDIVQLNPTHPEAFAKMVSPICGKRRKFANSSPGVLVGRSK